MNSLQRKELHQKSNLRFKVVANEEVIKLKRQKNVPPITAVDETLKIELLVNKLRLM